MDENAEKRGLPPKPMTIVLYPCDEQDTTKQRDLILARKLVEDILMKFRNVKSDGSCVRLLYKIARSCAGPHRPNNSTSHTVHQKNSVQGNKFCFLSLLELLKILH